MGKAQNPIGMAEPKLKLGAGGWRCGARASGRELESRKSQSLRPQKQGRRKREHEKIQSLKAKKQVPANS